MIEELERLIAEIRAKLDASGLKSICFKDGHFQINHEEPHQPYILEEEQDP